MTLAFTKHIVRITYLCLLTILLASLSPLTVMAEPEILSCTNARRQTENTLNTLRPLKQQQEQLQQQVRAVYQELITCQTGAELSFAHQLHCTQLQEEGPKQFQALVKAITRSHQISQQLARQSRQMERTCPTPPTEIPHNRITF